MNAPTLRTLLSGPDILLAPGVYDGLSALLVERAGFDAAYISGGSIAYTRFGRPDIGLVAMDEVAQTISVIRERVSIPLIVDADTGYGNALNVIRTVKLFARNGANALQLEDQDMPKRCGHLDEKRIVATGEMVGKIKAALDSRPSDEVLIIARTDAVGTEGLEAALDRAEAYREAGADILFVEALRSEADIGAAMKRLSGSAPLMANMVEGGKTPIMSARALQELGFGLVIFPGGLVRALTRTAVEYFDSLREHGTTTPFRDRMNDFQEINNILGTTEMLELGRRYQG